MRRFFTHMACILLLTQPSFAQDTLLSGSGMAFSLMFRDSIPTEVELVFDKDGLPDFYRSHVNTPVCNDGLCRSLILDVYWDLLGNFSRFVVPEFPPLTKWDHLEFTLEDHRKLVEILKDKNSVLGSVKDVNTLFDPSTKKISETVDAVTGATRETNNVDQTDVRSTDWNQRKSVQKVASPRSVSSRITTMTMAMVSPRRLPRGRNAVGSRLIMSTFYGGGSN